MKSGVLIALGAVGLVVAYIVLTKKTTAIGGALPLGATTTLSHAPDSTSGGVISSVASWLTGAASSAFTGPSSAVGDNNSPWNGNSTISNPVQSQPVVLPDSYKQQIVDNPILLESDDLFTPSYGSSGGYSDDTDEFGDSGF